jgi:Pyruvate/2-oxoacid:ferredoxin oxidoreductase delta subunit
MIDQCGARGLDCLVIPHLYHVADSSPLWKELSDRVDEAVLLCWLHPRPAEWLLRWRGIDCRGLTIFNLASFPTAEAAMHAILDALGQKVSGTVSDKPSCKTTVPDTFSTPTPFSTRWYPVIDGSRCVHCGHCLQFCLFGVYELDSQGHVEVCHPDQCKPGCPACSRICPQSAIMFPLYERDAAIAGAPGHLVTRDAAARRMFYQRTGQPCPVCGRKAARRSSQAAAAQECLCPECGQAQAAPIAADTGAPAAGTLPFDDLDELVDRLDQAMQRRH